MTDLPRQLANQLSGLASQREKLAEREGFEPFFYREDKLLRNTELIDDCYFSYRKTKAVNCRKVKPKHCNLATLWQPLVGDFRFRRTPLFALGRRFLRRNREWRHCS